MISFCHMLLCPIIFEGHRCFSAVLGRLSSLLIFGAWFSSFFFFSKGFDKTDLIKHETLAQLT